MATGATFEAGCNPPLCRQVSGLNLVEKYLFNSLFILCMTLWREKRICTGFISVVARQAGSRGKRSSVIGGYKGWGVLRLSDSGWFRAAGQMDGRFDPF